MLKPFLRVVSISEALNKLKQFKTLSSETISLEEASHRVTTRDVISQTDLPCFNRSTMDGFAVRAKDTFGATESSPGLFTIIGEIRMGEIGDITLRKGEAVKIWTGGSLPAGADAVVMIEQTEQVDESTIEVLKAVAPFENVIRKGEDFRTGEKLIEANHRLRPADNGLLAAMGINKLEVFAKPRVAVISSGDEIVPIDQEPLPGCVRDINRHTIIALIKEVGCSPSWMGIASDTLESISNIIDKSLETTDMVLISGGSSMGSRDYVIEAIESHDDSEILLHGVSISPGKPLIVSRIGDKPVIGLPGHPVSAMICFEQFVIPLLRLLEGENSIQPYLRPTIEALLTKNVPSKEGRTDFVRVKLEFHSGTVTAVPISGKSGAISAMSKADGSIIIGEDCEGLYKGDNVVVHLFSNWLGANSETKHIPGYEASARSPRTLFEPSKQEKLSSN